MLLAIALVIIVILLIGNILVFITDSLDPVCKDKRQDNSIDNSYTNSSRQNSNNYKNPMHMNAKNRSYAYTNDHRYLSTVSTTNRSMNRSMKRSTNNTHMSALRDGYNY